ncbi:flagellin [Nitriliruptoraceae bacterium ZYF776]|nr:flagellin [Profundirhabdus halotolerans]
MRINQNTAAFNAYRNLSQTQGAQAKSLEKLSSGFRINRAADDASGLVNSENLRAQIGGLKVATRNAQDAISLVQTAEGAQTEVHSILQRMRDLAVQSGNLGTNDDESLAANQAEFGQLRNELNRISDQTQFGTKKIFTEFNGTEATEATNATAGSWAASADAELEFDTTNLSVAFSVDGVEYTVDLDQDYADADALASALNAAVDGGGDTPGDVFTAVDGRLTLTSGSTGATSTVAITTGATELGFTGTATAGQAAQAAQPAAGGAVFQVGANSGQQVRVVVNDVSAEALGLTELSIGVGSDADSIDDVLDALDSAISTVSENRANLGAFQNRMESTIRNVGVAVENLSAAESRIRDTDMAEEMVSFTRSQILSQAGTAMLAQANQVLQSVLSLLR